jgi:4-amino-4-deoxy-L-arabinose transferase-like glycosyltransferase
MQARGDWIVPIVDGQPYLAKPPMMYWWQLALASVRNAETGEFELRLTVALAGWIGVLATYIVGRRLEQGAHGNGSAAQSPGHLDTSAPRHLRGEAAWWAALFLATGLLYVRSSRVGELDILLVPFSIVAIGAVHAAWRRHMERGRMHFAAVGVAVLAACAAMLTKGPPGILAIGVGAYGGIALWHARGEQRRLSRGSWAAIAIGAAAMVTAALTIGSGERDFEDALGLVIYALMGGLLGWFADGLLRGGAARQTFRAYARTHPLAVMGLPFLALWLWGHVVGLRIGPEALQLAVKTEAADNLRAFVLVSPARNLSAAAYGAGLGSLAAICAGVWLVARRVRLTPELAILIAWVVGGLIAFSVLGKGVARYLTPVWPGLALLGGIWWARTWPRLPYAPWMRGTGLLAVGVAALIQTWWYGLGREQYNADRSPRAFVQELLAKPDVDANRLVMLGFETPAIAYYARARVPVLGDMSGMEAERLAGGDGATILLREGDVEKFQERLREAGLHIERLPLESGFQVDHRRARIAALRISPRPAPDEPAAATSPPTPPAASDPPG